MLGFLLITLIFIGALVGFSKAMDVEKIKKDWPKYRCRPDVMLMADFYGHDSGQNLEYCLKSGFDERSSSAIAPFYTYLKGFVEVLLTLLQSINSIRMIFATIIGSVTQVFGEFSGRIQTLLYRIQYTAVRMRFLMSRLFSMMYGIMFMGMSGIKAGQNFGNTFLFRFLDTFCFPPWTQIRMRDGTSKQIQHVAIGEELEGGERVTAVFKFAADGQEMVAFPGGLKVSTNHHVLHKGKWIRAEDHPEVVRVGGWAGGTERPLICLNTDTHSFKIQGYTFRDYDETSEGDKEAMRLAETLVNGRLSKSQTSNSEMAVSPGTSLKLKEGGGMSAHTVTLGTQLSLGTVVGIVKKEVYSTCWYKGNCFAAGTLVWHEELKDWKRVEELVPPATNPEGIPFYSFVVTPSASLETEEGVVFRDYVEVHSPDMEASYEEALAKGPTILEC
jgi:hypothetical protein